MLAPGSVAPPGGGEKTEGAVVEQAAQRSVQPPQAEGRCQGHGHALQFGFGPWRCRRAAAGCSEAFALSKCTCPDAGQTLPDASWWSRQNRGGQIPQGSFCMQYFSHADKSVSTKKSWEQKGSACVLVTRPNSGAGPRAVQPVCRPRLRGREGQPSLRGAKQGAQGSRCSQQPTPRLSRGRL